MNNSTITNLPQIFSLYLLPLSIVFTLGGLLGGIGNALIIYAIYKNKTLHNQCHYLMQQLAIADMVSCLGFIQMGLTTILLPHGAPPSFMLTNVNCVKLLSPLITSLVAGNIFVLIIGVDRFIAVYFVHMYDLIPLKLVIFYISISWSSGVALTLIALYSSSNDLVPACFPPTAFQGLSLDIWNTSGICLNALVIFVYLLVIIGAKRKFSTNVESTQKKNRKWKVIKTLVVVVMVFVFTWTATTVILKILIEIQVSGPVLFHGVAYVGVLCLANISLNFIIYFTRISEFQATIIFIFGKRGLSGAASVGPTTIVTAKI